MLVISLIFSTTVRSDATFLEKGAKAPFEGILYTIEETQSFRKDLIERDYLKLQNDSLNRSVDLYKSNESLYQSQKNLLLEQNDKLAKSLYQERNLTDTQKFLYFMGGVALTGLAIYGASQLVQR